MDTHTKTYSPETIIRNLLNETDLPRDIKFNVTNVEGVLRVNLKDYHERPYQY